MARHQHLRHRASHLRAREAIALPRSEPSELAKLLKRQVSGLSSLLKRQSSGSSDCSNGSGDTCKPDSQSNNVTLPVALGVIIPIVFAVVLFFFLHRRHVRRLRAEDLNDPHKSLDFGWDPASQAKQLNGRDKSKKNKKGPEMSVAEFNPSEKRGRGMSMDLDLGSPYVLPPALHSSRESLHSMTRTVHSQDDRYRPATTYQPNDASSLRSTNTRRGADDSSMYTSSSSVRRANKDDMNQNLLGNAQRMSRSQPPTDRIPDVPQIRMPEPAQKVLRKSLPSTPVTPSGAGLSPNAQVPNNRDSYTAGDENVLRRSDNYLGNLISSGNSTVEPHVQANDQRNEFTMPKELPNPPAPIMQSIKRKSPPPIIDTETAQSQVTRPPRQQSLHASVQPSLNQNLIDDSSDYGEHFNAQPPSPHHSQQDQYHGDHHTSQAYDAPVDAGALGIDNTGLGFDVRRLSMGMRPLPDVDPNDHPEARANRIRSFYKEYFDDSKPAPSAPQGGYYEDYDEAYLGEGTTYFDPVSGQFVTAGAQYPQQQYDEPYGRRAMTPPPRVGGRRHAATMSNGSRLMPPGPRAYSSASGRFGPSGRGPPKKKLPPPGPLRVIPSPSLLKEDAFALPIDFAPPTSARDRAQGRPESPRGGLRPYSPMVPAHMPLQSSFDDLAAMPSPHLLRKSGTFTGLDFAPPPRFKTGSDAGSDDGRSIRSNRSAMSARQQQAIRAGAYRVSRIPKGVVFTKQDTMNSLKPQWNMHNNDSRVGLGNVGSGMIL